MDASRAKGHGKGNGRHGDAPCESISLRGLCPLKLPFDMVCLHSDRARRPGQKLESSCYFISKVTTTLAVTDTSPDRMGVAAASLDSKSMRLLMPKGTP